MPLEIGVNPYPIICAPYRGWMSQNRIYLRGWMSHNRIYLRGWMSHNRIYLRGWMSHNRIYLRGWMSHNRIYLRGWMSHNRIYLRGWMSQNRIYLQGLDVTKSDLPTGLGVSSFKTPAQVCLPLSGTLFSRNISKSETGVVTLHRRQDVRGAMATPPTCACRRHTQKTNLHESS